MFLLNAIESFIEAKKLSRFLPSLRIPLEMAVVKLTYKQDLVQKVDDSSADKSKEINKEPKVIKKEPGFQHKTATLNLENVSRFVDSLKGGFRHKPKQDTKSTEPAAGVEGVDIKLLSECWTDILDEIAKQKMAVATYLRDGQLLSAEGAIVNIGFAKNLSFNKEFLQNSERKEFVEEVVRQKLNRRVNIQYTLTDMIQERKQQDSSKETISKIVEAFGGEVVT